MGSTCKVCLKEGEEIKCVSEFRKMINREPDMDKFKHFKKAIEYLERARLSNEFGGTVFSTIGGHPDGKRRINPLGKQL